MLCQEYLEVQPQIRHYQRSVPYVLRLRELCLRVGLDTLLQLSGVSSMTSVMNVTSHSFATYPAMA